MSLNKSILLSFLFITTFGFGQANKLCGIWMGYGYEAENVMPGGLTTFYYVPVEIISIQQVGNVTIATKILGDDCVTSGHVTWIGNDIADTFNVLVSAGSPLYPNSAQGPGTIFYLDSTHINLSNSVNYVRATCYQIDSMSNLFTNADMACTNCGLLVMPNTFTPNGDGINDMFQPVLSKNLHDYSLQIFNRWGTVVFSNVDYTWGWDGKTNNQDCPSGTYYWVCSYKTPTGEQLNKKGFLELIR